MTKSPVSSWLLSPASGITAAFLIVAIFASQGAEAMSPIHPGMSNIGKGAAHEKAVAGEPTIEVRGGHGGGGGGVDEAVVGAAATALAASVALLFAAARSARRQLSSQELLDLPVTVSVTGVTSAGFLSAASITTIIRTTLPITTMIPPSIRLPPLSLEEVAAGC